MLVTGANNQFGIGAAAARAFARLGATLFLHYHRTQHEAGEQANVYRRQQTNTADALLADIAAIGGRAAAFEADFTDPASVASLFDAPERYCGSVDVLINNAAAWSADTFLPPAGARRNPFLELWTDAARPIARAGTATLHGQCDRAGTADRGVCAPPRRPWRELGPLRQYQHRRIGVLSVTGELVVRSSESRIRNPEP